MGSYNETAIPGAVLSANNVLIMMGSQEVGFGQTASFKLGFNVKAQFGIGSQKIQELQSQRFIPSVTLSMFALSNTGVRILNAPSTLADLLATSALNLVVLDNFGQPLYIYEGCMVNDFDLQIDVTRPVVQKIQFYAMDVLDNLGMSILVGDPFAAFASMTASIAGLINKNNKGVGII